jgi:hypothetical protein
MTVNPERLQELLDSLSQDQKELMRAALANGENLDPEKLASIVNSLENQEEFRKLAAASAPSNAGAPDGGSPEAGTPDGGTSDGGTTVVPPEPPLTRW